MHQAGISQLGNSVPDRGISQLGNSVPGRGISQLGNSVPGRGITARPPQSEQPQIPGRTIVIVNLSLSTEALMLPLIMSTSFLETDRPMPLELM